MCFHRSKILRIIRDSTIIWGYKLGNNNVKNSYFYLLALHIFDIHSAIASIKLNTDMGVE